MIQFNTKNWQLKVDALGDVVSEAEDIAQCLKTILTTPRGSVPLDSGFGSKCWHWIDAPVDVARAGLVRSSYEALESYEPRAKIKAVSADHTANGKVHLTIDWEFSGESTHVVSKQTEVVL